MADRSRCQGLQPVAADKVALSTAQYWIGDIADQIAEVEERSGRSLTCDNSAQKGHLEGRLGGHPSGRIGLVPARRSSQQRFAFLRLRDEDEALGR